MTPILGTSIGTPLMAIGAVALFAIVAWILYEIFTGPQPCLHCNRDFERMDPRELICPECDRISKLWRKPRKPLP